MEDMKIIEDFPVSIGKICLISQISDILCFYGVHLNESCLLGLCEGYQFYYGGIFDKPDQRDVRNLIKLGGMKYDIPMMLCRLKGSLGLAVEGYIHKEERDAEYFIRSYVDKNIPVLAFVMADELTYSMSYRKDSLSHAIGIYGYDFDSGRVWVTDTYVNTKPVSSYKGELGFSHVLRGFDLSRAMFEMQSEERMYAIYPKHPVEFQQIPIEDLNQTLVKAAKDNLCGVQYREGILGGIEAVKLLESDYGTWGESFTSDILMNLMKALHNQITNFGGPAVTSRMMSEYLETIYEREKKITYRNFSRQFYRLYCLWLLVGNLCYKNALKGIYSDSHIAERLSEIREVSEQLYYDILQEFERK